MSFIDVSDVLLDPMIAGQEFLVVRRQQTVNNFGETVIGQAVFSALGSVTPVGANSLLREEAYQVQQKTLRVVTSARLRGVSEDVAGVQFQPDLIYWPVSPSGDYFLVKVLNDYSQFGAGVVEAECASIDYSDLPPWQLPQLIGAMLFANSANSALLVPLRV
jgi:hypothetical protein